MVVVIVGREFAVSGLRHLAHQQGVVIAANWWGKLKTFSQIVAVSLLLSSYQLGQWVFLSKAALWVALALTVASLISYFSSFWRLVVGDGR